MVTIGASPRPLASNSLMRARPRSAAPPCEEKMGRSDTVCDVRPLTIEMSGWVGDGKKTSSRSRKEGSRDRTSPAPTSACPVVPGHTCLRRIGPRAACVARLHRRYSHEQAKRGVRDPRSSRSERGRLRSRIGHRRRLKRRRTHRHFRGRDRDRAIERSALLNCSTIHCSIEGHNV